MINSFHPVFLTVVSDHVFRQKKKSALYSSVATGKWTLCRVELIPVLFLFEQAKIDANIGFRNYGNVLLIFSCQIGGSIYLGISCP